MLKRSLAALACGALAATSLVTVAGATSAPPTPDERAAAARATAWIATQQQPDGGFEVAMFPGFETPDAVLALAETAQTGRDWSTTEAYAAVAAQVSGSGNTPLDYLEAFTEDPALTAGQAAKLIVLNALPLGLDPAAFDPAGDGDAVDLVGIVDAAWSADGGYSSPGALNGTLYAALAAALLDAVVPAETVQYVRDAQTVDGGWSYDADPEGFADIDSTALALQALAAAGLTAADPTVTAGLGYLATQQQASGAWQSFGADDPNATSTAVFALTAFGLDVGARAWRDHYDPAGTGDAYASPLAWMLTQQESDGRIVSPNDGFGINTFATSQTVQALERSWLPIAGPSYAVMRADSTRIRFDANGSSVDRIPGQLNQPVVAYSARGRTSGWAFAADGGVFSYDGAPFFGSLGDIRLNAPVVTAATTPSGDGYWMFAADGGVFTFGDAEFYGSLGGVPLNQPVVTAVSTPSGQGYWLFAADGGVFTFGDAEFYGSLGGTPLNQPITAGTSTGAGGYWLFASDGGVFSFGDARFFGSLGGLALNQPITAGTNRGDTGYWLFGADGGVFTFGSALFYGSAVGVGGTAPVVAAS